MNERYERIIDIPRQKPKTKPPMTIYERAAQFAPYAALSGYEDSVKETARLTDRRIELDDYEIERLDARLREAGENLGKESYRVVYFVPDKKKSGGAYVTKIDRISEIDEYLLKVKFFDGESIAIDDIIEIEVHYES